MTDTFKPVHISEYFLKQIAAGLKKEIYDTLFKQIFEVLNDNSILNDKNTLTNAIRSGRIYYENGAGPSVHSRRTSRRSAAYSAPGQSG